MFFDYLKSVFSNTQVTSTNEHIDVGHGRIEKRICQVITDLSYLDEKEKWRNIASVIKIDAERINKKTEKVQKETRFYISSKSADASQFNKDIRGHWSIENKLHWSLDVCFREDSSKQRVGNSAVNMNIIRKIAINLLNQVQVKKRNQNTKPQKRYKAALNNQFREKLLQINT